MTSMGDMLLAVATVSATGLFIILAIVAVLSGKENRFGGPFGAFCLATACGCVLALLAGIIRLLFWG